MKRIFTLVSILFLFASTSLFAQAPTWEAITGGTVNWQRVTPFGTLVVSTSEGIKGIDPQSGSILWRSKSSLGAAPESSFTMIENTPFFSVQSGSGSNEDFCIIESFEGNQIFSSIDAGLQKVNSQYFLHLSGAILVLGTEFGSKIPRVFMIDMATGKKIWDKSSDFGIVSACKDLGNNECIITTGFFIIKLNVKTGEEIWKKSIDPKFESMSNLFTALDQGSSKLFDPSQITAAIATTPNYPNGVYVTVQSTIQKSSTDSKGVVTTSTYIERNYMGFDIRDGDALWPKLINLPGPVGIVYASTTGLVVAVGEYPKNVPNLVQTSGPDVQCFNYENGEGLWGKKGNGINIKGGVLRTIVPVDENLLLVSGRLNNFIDMVDPSTGASVIEKETKVSGQVEYVSKIDKGVFYATEDEVNIVDLAEGKKVFDKPFKSNSKLIIETESEIAVFNLKDKILYKINPATGEAIAFSEAIEWEGKETANSIEKREDGYLIMSDQNMVLINNSGSIVYNKYFVAPVDNGWKKALYFSKAIFSAFASMVYTYNAGIYGAVSQSIQVNSLGSKITKDITKQISDAYGDAAKSSAKYAAKMIEKATNRYKATQQANDFAFILTTVDKKTAQLIRIDKKTGEIVNTIALDKDKTPMYEIDGLENRVFYKSAPTKIEGYQY